MGTQNSRIEIYLGVIRNLLDDLLIMIESSPSLRNSIPFNCAREIERDFRYIESRTKHEGLEFLTVQLPRLGKWFDRVLSGNNEALVQGFKPYTTLQTSEGNFACPLFLRIYAYTLHESSICDQERAEVFRLYRSLLFLFYKLEVPLETRMLDANLHKWKFIEDQLTHHEYPEYYSQVVTKIRELISSLFSGGEHCFEIDNPRHGPGAVAGREVGDGKWENPAFIRPLHLTYSWYDTYFGYRLDDGMTPCHMLGKRLCLFETQLPSIEATSRLLFVPKDSRGPRTISCEPKELMFLQQSVCHKLMAFIHSRTHGEVNFIDQTVNQRLARSSSVDQNMATLDLEDASDRISKKLISLVFPDWMHEYLFALRSVHTRLPDGTLFRHHAKYAPMGSALCFPIESVLFWAIARVSLADSASDPIEGVYVYGDDVILPPPAVDNFINYCTMLALRVNTSKSYTHGPFRESCGFDAWKGLNVTPFKIKKDIGSRSLDGPLATAICEYSSTCFSLNYRKTGECLYHHVNSVYRGVIRDYRTWGCLHVVDPLAIFDKEDYQCRYNKSMCRLEVRGWVLSVPKSATTLNSVERLHKNIFGSWKLHDPSQVVAQRTTKIRKRYVVVGG